MVRTDFVSIGRKFEPAIALRRAILQIVWERRVWTVVATLSLLTATASIATLAFIALFVFASRIAPSMLIWLFWLILTLSAGAMVAAGLLGVRWLISDRFSKVVACVDEKLGSDAIRNALDLARLREDEKFVSPHFARIAIYRAWQLWQNANQNGLKNELLSGHKRRALSVLAIALPISLLTLSLTLATNFSISALTEIYRNAQAFLIFEREGQLQLSVGDDDKVLLKGTIVPVFVRAYCPNSQLPKNLTVWLLWRTDSKTERMQMRQIDSDKFSAELTVSGSGTVQAFSGKVRSNEVHL
ncbi:MAG: hypothetical protein ACK40X_11805, partial [Armatimonadota bacterium]